MNYIYKLNLILCSLLVLCNSSSAQSPNKMSYQAVIRNSSNALVTNQSVGMRISILQGSASGTAVYTERQSPVTNTNGLISIEIGGGTVVNGNIDSINWAGGPYFVKTETDPAGGTNYTITATSQLLSVPYALYAKSAGSVSGGNSSGGFTHYIGEKFGGGVVFHLWKDSTGAEHGLVVALTNQSTAAAWSNITSTAIGSSAQSSWDGLSNSNAIVAQSGHTFSAAKLCLDLVSGGYSDWYLPAIDELVLLINSRFLVNQSLSKLSGATILTNSNTSFNSSTEDNANYVWKGSFSAGGGYSEGKLYTTGVRAVRRF